MRRTAAGYGHMGNEAGRAGRDARRDQPDPDQRSRDRDLRAPPPSRGQDAARRARRLALPSVRLPRYRPDHDAERLRAGSEGGRRPRPAEPITALLRSRLTPLVSFPAAPGHPKADSELKRRPVQRTGPLFSSDLTVERKGRPPPTALLPLRLLRPLVLHHVRQRRDRPPARLPGADRSLETRLQHPR
jgi:hypothetical protein